AGVASGEHTAGRKTRKEARQTEWQGRKEARAQATDGGYCGDGAARPCRGSAQGAAGLRLRSRVVVSQAEESPFQVLGIAPTLDLGAVKRAYFAALTRHPPHADPEGFRRLRAAYEPLPTA